LRQICLDERVAPRSIHLELTEREDASEPVTAQTVARLRNDGFHVGLDDFGIGYSNLAYLDALPVDYIKIDRAFASGAGRRGAGGEILDHIIAIAEARKLEVIAEGVETEEQRAGLIARNVRLGQGWLFGRPMTILDFMQSRPPVPTGRTAKQEIAA
jgi:sensor c-di-GMP phosphodiesterase-like protein